MKTIHAVRPHYPTYRDSSQMTAKRPVLELVLGGLMAGFIAFAGFALIEIYAGAMQ